ncbi:DEAD/DEAH box helicase [Stratiformator vulcanicus]|uniref:RNA polymerase-associated protein RapA n=1 Tax=Stratiformator vulcanicus TaxID=2527980 RepID=A0A517R780_9PLAN|nr:DEAD/DEAH box helicase [Stratiformator vulcanicus]QDT39746.1 RNA polymerase-associated protein RapA [Stratiformator vulcanicus]
MQAAKTYGRLWKEEGRWLIECEPHVKLWVKRIFRSIPTAAAGVVSLPDTPEVGRNLEWFCDRFPLSIEGREDLTAQSRRHRDKLLRLRQITGSDYRPEPVPMALPPRHYQAVAADLWAATSRLLLADDLGLGKTVTTIAGLIRTDCRPAIVVCPAHLPRQWEAEINKFAPDLSTHILKKSTPYELPAFFGRGPDVLISSYHKLAGWADVLRTYCRAIVFDECQELRHAGSQKFMASTEIADQCEYVIGLSATPIYNYGSEIWNIFRVLKPDALGRRDEFIREWCSVWTNKERIKEAEAFGCWLKDNHLMLRRTRRDVDRELPDLTRVTQFVDCDEKALSRIEDAAGELARIILSEEKLTGSSRMEAASEFSMILRQATGIAKAPFVAAFVRMLIESGEPVVLFGWHRAVYDLWQSKLGEFHPAFYTGEESTAAKQRAKDSFVAGETDLLIISLRSGAGLDGLQNRGRTLVFGELDWSPGVHEQCTGRIHRDGQSDPVTAYYMLSEGGLDPLMAETLGLKRQQVDGIRADGDTKLVERVDSGEAIKKLARRYLKSSG